MKSETSDRRTILRNAGIVGAATVASRVLGLLRDAVLAAMLGASFWADAFFVAFRIPNLSRQLLGEGALSASFVPVYTDVLQKKGEESVKEFSDHLFSLLVLVLTLLTLAGIFFAPWLVRIIALGFDPDSEIFTTTVLLTRWMLPYMIFVCAAALGMGILNSRGHFLTPALAPALLNLSIISFALLVAPSLPVPVVGVAWGVLVGGLLQLLIQYPPMKAMGVLPTFGIPSLTPEVRRVGIMMGPAILGVTVYQLNILVDTVLASFLPTGSITYLWYGNRMMQFPLGVFGIALATAALPTMSRQVSEGRREDFWKTVSFSLGLTAFIGFPAALGLIALREPIMAALFGRGAFGVADVAGAGRALFFYSLGLPFFIGIKILGRAFFARENTKIPFTAASLAFLVNAVLDVVLMGPMGHAGLALATSLASIFNFLFLASSFTRREGVGWMDEDLLKESARAMAAALIMFTVVWAATRGFTWMDLSTLQRVGGLFGCMGLGFGVYFAAALVFGCKGLKTLKNRFLSRGVR